MKPFSQYLIESQSTYDFKIKIAGDTPDDAVAKIKTALINFDPVDCSKGMSVPIQETHADFPEHKNVGVTVFDVSLNYPATSDQVRNQVANSLGISQSCVRTRNPMECKEYEINHQYDDIPKEALLTKDYEKLNNQHLVGEKQKFELLKELSKEKHCGTQYKGVNDKILGKKAPVEKVTAPTTKTTKSVSPLGSRKPTLPTAKTAREIK